MTRKENILNELNELKSMLVTVNPENIYAVPAGYFEGLAELVLNRIKAMEAINAAEELSYLSPSLKNISRQMPYDVPAGYFEGLAEKTIRKVHENNVNQSSKEELETLSPLLSGLKKTMPYSIPEGYFENLAEKRNKPVTKVVSFTHRSWFRYAAAAVVTGVVVLSGLIILNTRKSVDPVKQPYAWVKKSIKEVDKAVIEDFVTLADEEYVARDAVASGPVKPEEIKELMKDVSDKEIQDFLDETAGLESSEEMMVN